MEACNFNAFSWQAIHILTIICSNYTHSSLIIQICWARPRAWTGKCFAMLFIVIMLIVVIAVMTGVTFWRFWGLILMNDDVMTDCNSWKHAMTLSNGGWLTSAVHQLWNAIDRGKSGANSCWFVHKPDWKIQGAPK